MVIEYWMWINLRILGKHLWDTEIYGNRATVEMRLEISSLACRSCALNVEWYRRTIGPTILIGWTSLSFLTLLWSKWAREIRGPCNLHCKFYCYGRGSTCNWCSSLVQERKSLHLEKPEAGGKVKPFAKCIETYKKHSRAILKLLNGETKSTDFDQ